MPATLRGDLLFNEPTGTPRATLILAHGAGAGMDSHPLEFFAESLAAQNIRVVRFEFPYMRLRQREGRRKPPDSPEVLTQTWRDVIQQVRGGVMKGATAKEASRQNLFIGGKSMGGRIASMVADDAAVTGLICLGYPFHPPGKPQQLRIRHLQELKTPALILQGERDPFGSQPPQTRPGPSGGPQRFVAGGKRALDATVAGYPLSPAIRIAWVPDGDHSFKPRKQSGHTERENLDFVLSQILAFISPNLAG